MNTMPVQVTPYPVVNDWSYGLKIYTNQHHARCMERDAQGHHTTHLVINTPRDDKATRRQSRYEKWKLSRKGKSRWWFCCCFFQKNTGSIAATEPLYIP